MSRNPDRGPAAVYRHINAAGEVIYIGCAVDPYRRFSFHSSQSKWAHDVVRMDIMWHPTWRDALAEEKRLIEAEQPRFNGIHTRKKRTRVGNAGHLYVRAWINKFCLDEREAAKRLGVTPARVMSLQSERSRVVTKFQMPMAVKSDGYIPSWAWDARMPHEWTPISDEDAAKHKAYAEDLIERWRRYDERRKAAA
jgi:hypothetical protein